MLTIHGSNCYLLAIPLPSPFKLHYGTLSVLPRVIYQLELKDSIGKSYVGIGEASIDFPFVSYDTWDIYWSLSNLGKEISGLSFDSREELFTHPTTKELLLQFPAAFAAFNMAVDDAFCKSELISVLELYGIKREGGRALYSIGFVDDTNVLQEKMSGVVNQGYIPKIKVGNDPSYDCEIIAVAEHLSKQSDTPIISYALDFNAAYTVEQLEELINSLVERVDEVLGHCIAFEQPTQESLGVEGLVSVRNLLLSKGIEIPVFADEVFINQEDALRCAEHLIGLNFKIQKVGGIVAALEIEEALLRQGFDLDLYGSMVGGTFPTAIGRVYDQQAASVLNSSFYPSDGWQPSTEWFVNDKHLIKENFSRNEDGTFSPIRGLGLGIFPDWSKIARFILPNPEVEYSRVRRSGTGEILQIETTGDKTYGELYKELSGREPDWNL